MITEVVAPQDDVPTISTTGTPPTLAVDETTLGTNATQSVAANFSSAFGANGAGAITYALGVVAGPSGLVDTLTHEAVILSLTAGGVVEGRTVGTNQLVFTVAIDGAGNVTLDQIRAVEHTPDSGPDQSTTLSAANLVTVTATITDSDGDPASSTLNIGQSLVFHDDAPTAVNDTPQSVAEDGAAIGGNVLTNDTQGSDGATLTHVNLGSGLVAITSGTNLGGGVYQFATSNGTYTFTADGTWTFDPNTNLNNASGLNAGFTYQITDGDGDTSTALQPITVTDGTVAATPAAVTLDVDESALSTTGATGSHPSLTTETDSAPSLTFTAGSDNLTSFAFSNSLAGLVTDLNGVDGQDIWWYRVSDTQIKGFLDAGHTQLAVTLDLSAPQSIAAGASGDVTVTMTLSDNLLHPAGNSAQISSIGNVGVVATDTDGDLTTGTVNLTVKDDAPTAVNDTPQSVAEDGAAIGGNVLTNDTQGSDGATLTHVNLGSGLVAITSGTNLGGGVYQFATSNGTYTFTADGTWTFDPNTNLNNASGLNAGFTYQITDGDGDTSTALQPITVTDGTVAATPAAVTLDVDESALSTAGATGSHPLLTTETDSAPSLTFTAGSDNLTSFAFSNSLAGLVTDLNGVDGQDIWWSARLRHADQGLPRRGPYAAGGNARPERAANPSRQVRAATSR